MVFILLLSYLFFKVKILAKRLIVADTQRLQQKEILFDVKLWMP